MKNLSTSYHAKPADYLLEPADDNAGSTLSRGIYHQVDDWVALELTAEQMLSNEVSTVTSYVAGDTREFWEAIKDSLLPFEVAAGQLLLEAADPTQVEWSQNHWWEPVDDQLH